MTSPVAFVVGLVLFAAALYGLRRLKQQDHAAAAAALTLTPVAGAPTVAGHTGEGWPCHDTLIARGVVSGVPAELISRSIPNLFTPTRERVASQFTVLRLTPPVAPTVALRLQPTGLSRAIEQLTHATPAPIPTGDEAFDAAFHLYATSADAALRTLSPSRRAALTAFADASVPPGWTPARRLAAGVTLGTFELTATHASYSAFGSPARQVGEHVARAAPLLTTLLAAPE